MAKDRFRYTVSFLTNDQELIGFVEGKRKTINFSSYVRELIRKDMGQVEDRNFEELYEYLLRRMHETGHFGLENQQKPLVDEMDKETIINLF